MVSEISYFARRNATNFQVALGYFQICKGQMHNNYYFFCVNAELQLYYSYKEAAESDELTNVLCIQCSICPALLEISEASKKFLFNTYCNIYLFIKISCLVSC